MSGLITAWSLVALVLMWVFFDRLWDASVKLGIGTRDVFVEMGKLVRRYTRAYLHTGRHRRDNPPHDSEVDRWPGADEEFVDTLRGMNAAV